MSERVNPSSAGDLPGSSGSRSPREWPPNAGGTEGLTGWVRFGGVIMTIIGLFGIIEGLAALLTPTTYIRSANGTVFSIDLSAWGWLHLILGVLLVVAGANLLREGAAWARALGTVLVSLSILVQMAWMPSYPLWAIIMIALDVLVIYALVATWDDR